MRIKPFKISKKKFYSILIMLIILIIEILFFSIIKKYSQLSGIDKIRYISVLGNVSFVLSIVVWKYLTGEIFSPYTVFLFSLFLFTCGQTIGWAFGLEMGAKDLMYRTDHGLNLNILYEGITFSLLSITTFHIGAICGEKISLKCNKKIQYNNNLVLNVYRNIGKLLICICLPAYIIKSVIALVAVFNGGYLAYYTTKSLGSIYTVISMISELYLPSLLILLISHKNNKSVRNIIVIAMVIDVVIELYIGGRSGAVMTVLALILTYHYYIKPISKYQTITFGIFGYLGLAVLNAVADIRGMMSKGLTDIINAIFSSMTNVIGDFVGELGWTMTSICWTATKVPSIYPYRYGMSYLVSLISWIPSFFFGGASNHPTVIWGNLADWQQKVLNMSYGPGYTMIAESYINFGQFGLLFMVIIGFILSKLIAKTKRTNAYNEILNGTFQIIVIMVVMKSLIRSSMSVAIRTGIFVILPIYLIIKYEIKKRRKYEN